MLLQFEATTRSSSGVQGVLSDFLGFFEAFRFTGLAEGSDNSTFRYSANGDMNSVGFFT
jgi:hypothetical protein